MRKAAQKPQKRTHKTLKTNEQILRPLLTWRKICVKIYTIIFLWRGKMEEMLTEATTAKKKKINWKEIWDRFTTGLLILELISPVLVLAYIFLWFIMRNL